MRRVIEVDFSAGKVICPTCHAEEELYFNGGELDEWRCCGVTYQQEARGYDLIATDEDDE